MYSSSNSILLIGLTISIMFLWCTVQPSSAEVNDDEHHPLVNFEEDGSFDDEYNDFYRRASLRPVIIHQRASLRPFAGKRASLRPFAGKRASLRPTNHMGKRKRRSILYDD